MIGKYIIVGLLCFGLQYKLICQNTFDINAFTENICSFDKKNNINDCNQFFDKKINLFFTGEKHENKCNIVINKGLFDCLHHIYGVNNLIIEDSYSVEYIYTYFKKNKKELYLTNKNMLKEYCKWEYDNLYKSLFNSISESKGDSKLNLFAIDVEKNFSLSFFPNYGVVNYNNRLHKIYYSPTGNSYMQTKNDPGSYVMHKGAIVTTSGGFNYGLGGVQMGGNITNPTTLLALNFSVNTILRTSWRLALNSLRNQVINQFPNNDVFVTTNPPQQVVITVAANPFAITLATMLATNLAGPTRSVQIVTSTNLADPTNINIQINQTDIIF